ncbi:hypothetical protein [Parafrankia elaeagni]|uniref:hypothetical protein n=1 Tax=Parafrankia elaeagni TaxID=222534 RepID=UPI0012B50769|nr:hypothetical protein [Parafrankia elaeagni]
MLTAPSCRAGGPYEAAWCGSTEFRDLVMGPSVMAVTGWIDDGKAVEVGWQTLQGGFDRRRVATSLDEQLQAWAEVMVGGDLVVEPEDLGALAKQRGRVGHAPDQLPDALFVEPSGELATGHARCGAVRRC